MTKEGGALTDEGFAKARDLLNLKVQIRQQ